MNFDTEWVCFCQNVRALREKHGFSLREAAKRLHVTPKTLALIERGELPQRTSAGLILRLSQLFSIPPKDLFLPK